MSDAAGRATRASAPATPGTGRAARIEAAFRAFIGGPDYPCLPGRSVVRRGTFRLNVYGELGSERGTVTLARDLSGFIDQLPSDGAGLQAFVAVFPSRAPKTELEFEHRLWTQLQRLHERDTPGAEWDPSVSADPEKPMFSFSFGRHALFVVGLHAGSSRLARRFRWPALVFNPHAQFRRLRSEGRFEGMRLAVRARDIALQGSLNPTLADFGQESEARQYSGRATESEWRCPFHKTGP